MKKFGVLLIVPLLFVSSFMSGCSQATAQAVSNAIQGVLNVASSEEAVLPLQDQAILKHWVDLGNTLDSQLNTCIAATGTFTKKATFLGCFNAFALGFTNPTELAQLRILSPASQGKAELWATAIIIGLNVGLDAFGGAAQPMPIITTTAPTAADLNQLKFQLEAQGYVTSGSLNAYSGF